MKFAPLLLLLASPAWAATTLDEAFRAATVKNESLQQAGERTAQSKARVKQLTGNVLPNISFEAAHLLQPKPKDPIAREFSPSQQTSAYFHLEQPLFRGLREFAGISQQRRLAEMQESLQSDAAIQLYEDVAANYLNILSLQQDQKNLEEQSRIYDQHVAELQVRTRRGESSTSELLTTQSTQTLIQADLRLVKAQLALAREEFHFLTGQPQNTELIDPKLVDTKAKVEPVDTYLARTEERPDIAAARYQAEATDKGVWVAKGAHLPTIDALANYYLKRPGFLSDIDWDVEFRLSFPIFQGGTTVAATRIAVSQRREAELELEKLRRRAHQEIRSYHDNYTARIEHVNILQASLDLAERNTQVSQRDYRRGLVRNIDVQLALSEYRNIRRTYDQARFAVQLDRLKLEAASAMRPLPSEGVSQ